MNVCSFSFDKFIERISGKELNDILLFSVISCGFSWYHFFTVDIKVDIT